MYFDKPIRKGKGLYLSPIGIGPNLVLVFVPSDGTFSYLQTSIDVRQVELIRSLHDRKVAGHSREQMGPKRCWFFVLEKMIELAPTLGLLSVVDDSEEALAVLNDILSTEHGYRVHYADDPSIPIDRDRIVNPHKHRIYCYPLNKTKANPHGF